MSKLVEVLWFSFIITELFFLFILFAYLRKEYVKALKNFYRRNVIKQTYSIIKNDSIKKEIIKENITKYIDIVQVKNQMPYAELIFYENGEFCFRTLLIENEILIGRGENNDISVDNNTVSRKQCRIIKEKEKVILKNYAKLNVTRVNGKEVKKVKQIRDGDVIKIGEVTIEFYDNLKKPSPTGTTKRRGKHSNIIDKKVKTGTNG